MPLEPSQEPVEPLIFFAIAIIPCSPQPDHSAPSLWAGLGGIQTGTRAVLCSSQIQSLYLH